MITADDHFVRAHALLAQADAAAKSNMQFGALLYLLRVVIEDLEAANAAGIASGVLKPYESSLPFDGREKSDLEMRLSGPE